MFLPPDYVEKRIPVLREFIRSNPLGVLTTAIQSDTYPFIQSSHIPWVLDVSDDESETEFGRLRGHMARLNPQSKSIIQALEQQANGHEQASSSSKILDQEVLVLFTDPLHHYVSPRFYMETMSTTKKTAPTWNYSAVQAYGRAHFYIDNKADETAEYLKTVLDDLARLGEVDIMKHTGKWGHPVPWQISDMPQSFYELLRKNIIGVEIDITRLEGKFKASQELNQADIQGVIKGFNSMGTDATHAMSQLIKERYEIKMTNKRLRNGETGLDFLHF
ncbi:putative FMN-binding domain-containing protein [Xylogone sp. PMI_703]|nr:putative FMN-binding domain-containing protein [Xylogone sp. PMI_703]